MKTLLQLLLVIGFASVANANDYPNMNANQNGLKGGTRGQCHGNCPASPATAFLDTQSAQTSIIEILYRIIKDKRITCASNLMEHIPESFRTNYKLIPVFNQRTQQMDYQNPDILMRVANSTIEVTRFMKTMRPDQHNNRVIINEFTEEVSNRPDWQQLAWPDENYFPPAQNPKAEVRRMKFRQMVIDFANNGDDCNGSEPKIQTTSL
ncbi:MAG: hypothetical protein AB7F59_07210 [Bdellovibrionales bacterium]